MKNVVFEDLISSVDIYFMPFFHRSKLFSYNYIRKGSILKPSYYGIFYKASVNMRQKLPKSRECWDIKKMTREHLESSPSAMNMKIYLWKQNYFIMEDIVSMSLEKVTTETTGEPWYRELCGLSHEKSLWWSVYPGECTEWWNSRTCIHSHTSSQDSNCACDCLHTTTNRKIRMSFVFTLSCLV